MSVGKTRFKNSEVLARGLGTIDENGVETTGIMDVGAVVQVMAITVPNAATGNVDTELEQDLKVIDAYLVVTGTNGANANSIQLRNGTTNALTDAMSTNGKSANDIVRAAELVPARQAFEAGDKLRIVRTRAGGENSCVVYVNYVAQ